MNNLELLLDEWLHTGKTAPSDGQFLDRGDERLYYLLRSMVNRIAQLEEETARLRAHTNMAPPP